VQVVDQQQERSVGGDVRRDPEEAVEDAVGDVGLGGTVLGRSEHPGRGLRGAGQPASPVIWIDQERIEQLPHDAERQLALEVAASGGEHAETGALRRFTSRGEQAALPDPGNTELTVALEQVAGRRRRGLRLAIDRHLGRPRSGLPLRDLSVDLVDDLGRDLVHAVLLARVHDDLTEDLVIGLAVEGGPAPGDQHAASELLHVEPPCVGGGQRFDRGASGLFPGRRPASRAPRG
jgi:hypothetical protein